MKAKTPAPPDNKKDQFLIGELAHLFNISTDTLRYYDKIGLIRPDIKGDNGYRYYSMRSFLKLSRILFLKDLDIPLEEIKDYMGNKNKEKLVELLQIKHADLELKIQSCLNLQSKIEQKLNLFVDAEAAEVGVTIKHFPRRQLLYLEAANTATSDHKGQLKRFGHLLKHSSWISEGQIYTSVSIDDLQSRQFEHFKYVFQIPDTGGDHAVLKSLPEGLYACLIFIGPYSAIDTHYTTLLDWIDANGYELCGDSIEKNIVDYDFSDKDEEFISELQIPIRLRDDASTPSPV